MANRLLENVQRQPKASVSESAAGLRRPDTVSSSAPKQSWLNETRLNITLTVIAPPRRSTEERKMLEEKYARVEDYL